MLMLNMYSLSFTGPSGSPQNLRATQRQLTSITLEWQPPLFSQQNGIITTYTVQVVQIGETLSTVTTTGLRLTISSLLSNSFYSFMVAASTVAGIGPYTTPSLTVQTLPPGILYVHRLQKDYFNLLFVQLLLAHHKM